MGKGDYVKGKERGVGKGTQNIAKTLVWIGFSAHSPSLNQLRLPKAYLGEASGGFILQSENIVSFLFFFELV